MIVSDHLRDLPVRFSHLKAYGRSAMHGLHARTTEIKQTSAMQRGTAVDALIFGHRKVIGAPMKRDERSAAYKEFLAENPDTEILTMAEFDKARWMADAIRACEYAKPWMQGATQATLMFDWMGLKCRATPDWRGDGFLTELKTTVDASEYKFPWQARRMSYPVQMWMQGIACELNGWPISRYFIVAAESSAPYVVSVFELTPRSLDKASRQLMLWAERLKTAESSGMWTPYSEAIIPLDEPEDDPELVYPDDETEGEQPND